MKTRRPLRELVPAIKRQFDKYREQIQFDYDLYQMHEGQIRQRVEESLSIEMLSKSAFSRAIQRIPGINIPRKVTSKLSKLYAEAPRRFAKSSQDEALMARFVRNMNVNAVFNEANHMTNLNWRAAVEIYLEEGIQKLRPLQAHQFFVFSDSITSPNTPTVFVKRLGRDRALKTSEQVVDRQGNYISNENDVELVDILAVYTDTEFMIMDSHGAMREDKMLEMGISSTRNPFGVIPFIYLNTSATELMPFPNQAAMDIGVLIPKLLTDLNYSAQFQSHSVIWTKNADLQGAEINPDAIVDLGDSDANGNAPEMGTIEPKTDIDGVLKLVEFQLSSYLSTVGIKGGSIGQLEASSAASGVSKIMDESDATEARKAQEELFRMAEREFWAKFAQMQDVWSRAGVVEEKETFSVEFAKTFSIKYAEIKPLESEKQKYDKMKVARDLKLITKKQALREIYPNLSEEQLDRRLSELDEELNKEKKEMLSMGLTPGFSQLDRQQEGKSDEAMATEQEEDGGSQPE